MDIPSTIFSEQFPGVGFNFLEVSDVAPTLNGLPAMDLLWIQQLSDGFAALSYFAIPLTIWLLIPVIKRITSTAALQKSNCELQKRLRELDKNNKALQTIEEELRCANEEQAAMTDELGRKMQQSERYISQLASAQETAELGYWSSDTEGNFIWSEQMYEIFGIPPRETGWGPTQEEYYATLHPEDRELYQRKSEEAIEVGRARCQLRVVKENGELCYVDVIAKKNVGSRGEFVGVSGVSRDVTDEVISRKVLIEAKETAEQVTRELERTKEMLERTNTVARVGGWEVDLIAHTVYWNRTTREIHEVPADFVPDLTTGINFYKAGYSRDTITQMIGHATDTGEPWDTELQIITHQGNERWVRAIGFAEFSQGTCCRLYGMFQDITTEVEGRMALMEAKDAAERAARAKQEFLANMSHEIRTPMNAIIGFSRLMLRSDLNQEQREYMQAIYDSADTLLVVINDILDFSKVEAGKLDIERVHFSLRKQLNLLERLFSVKVDDEHVRLVFETDSALPDALVGDPVRINQILNNLINNAVKFTKRGSVVVKTTWATGPERPSQVQISVRDSGIGIAPDKLDTIFESFSQEKGDTARQYGGTGLGLTIVKKLVTLMDGEITLESEAGVGSTFTITLTLPPGNEALISAEGESVDSLPIEQLEGVHVLLAEDNRNNQLLAKKFLTNVGCRVTLAVNGQEAVEQVQKDTYDIILMDIQMPVMDGMQATSAIKRLEAPYCDIPIVAMTAHALKEEEERYREHGMCGYVSKPFIPQQLYKTILGLVDNRSSEVISASGHPLRSVAAPAADPATHLLVLDQVRLDHLDAIAEDDPEFVNSMVSVFLEDVPEYLEQLQGALAQGDWASFKKSVHTLKSSVSFIGMNNLLDVIADIEQMNMKTTEREIIDNLYSYIRQNCEGAMEAMRRNLS